MEYNYRNIKKLAKQSGLSVRELLALASQNDPFYAGTATDISQAEWFADVWQRAGYTQGVHLRRVHYWCVSQDGFLMHTGKPYHNTDKCWKYLTQASKMARYLGYVRIVDIVDNKNPDPHEYAKYEDNTPEYTINIPQLDTPHIWIDGIHDTNAQPYHLEVWCEKSTMNDVLLPVCEDYNANLLTFEGEVSITSCRNLIDRIEKSDGKPSRVFYISDFDPAGNSMPVAMSRKIEYMLERYNRDYDVKIEALVLTSEQVQQYQLPRTPIKETEKRAASFEDAFGTGAVELDALEALYPGVLEDIVRQAISPYYSTEAEAETQRQEIALRQAIRTQVDAITARYADEIAALQNMIQELRDIKLDVSSYAVERFEPHVQETDETWLFNSERDYIDQIRFYKEHKGKAA